MTKVGILSENVKVIFVFTVSEGEDKKGGDVKRGIGGTKQPRGSSSAAAKQLGGAAAWMEQPNLCPCLRHRLA